MRFLCLHGLGTNSKVRQTQNSTTVHWTAALRNELGPDHTFEFVEGSYYHPDARSYMRAFQLLEAYIDANGPFDGIFGFSQGAGISLMYLIRHTHLHPDTPLPFKLAILFSRIGVRDVGRWVKTGEAVPLSSMPPGLDKLKLPVASIWGKDDWPTAKLEAATTEALVSEGFVWSFVHAGGHETPCPRIEGSVAGAAKVIKRAIAQSSLI
ncbi:hypothetical protein BU23DRAFT_453679 [Bimuria novae-zelandiae CBS 107.79]|uniref:Serine hydrolase domain-containing protein n=1 Tax=Bimuria novae-zelandiae CBS 107.79 TaxID=1447943 RepID=A0A6A5VJ15_9PLEO|nr:hypothetical protein BU23DRAFT_453679 [Bimuria novae-zelandiae CBS 107.79]